MNGKRALDISIVLCELAGIVLVCFFIGDLRGKEAIVAAMALVAAVFFILFLKDGGQYGESAFYREKGGKVSQIVLLNEENTEAAHWDVYGKTSIVFGRDERDHRMAMGNHVDIDLRDTAFAGTVDREHAVMNYYDGGWYLEDLESENGVRIQKAGEKKKLKVAAGSPCKVGQEDVIYLGLTKLKVR